MRIAFQVWLEKKEVRSPVSKKMDDSFEDSFEELSEEYLSEEDLTAE